MRLCRWLLVGLVALGGSGCAGYKLGPVNGLAARAKSVQVNPFANKTLEPRLGDEVTAQLRQQLQRDGTYQLASHNDGDIVVSGSVTRYVRQEVSFSPSDTLTVRDYRLELRAQVTAHERSTGKVILEPAGHGLHPYPRHDRFDQHRAPGAAAARGRPGQERHGVVGRGRLVERRL